MIVLQGKARFLPVLQYIEKHTAYDKGKGIKTSSIVDVHDVSVYSCNKSISLPKCIAKCRHINL